MEREENLLKNLIESRNNIKLKIMELKRGVLDSEHTFNETFKPIIEPLNRIVNNSDANKVSNMSDNETSSLENSRYDVEANTNKQLDEFNNFVSISPNKRTYDQSYGMHYDKANKQLKIGSYPITIKNDKISVADQVYDWTPGLWSLLCEKEPKLVNSEDLKSYYAILNTTKVYLNVKGNPKANKFYKWNSIVKPFYVDVKSKSNLIAKKRKIDEDFTNTPKSADAILSKNPFDFLKEKKDENLDSKLGMGLYKNILPNTQIIYYDNPNELVTRLALLLSSQAAGNTGLNNEVISIVEELRERKIIV